MVFGGPNVEKLQERGDLVGLVNALDDARSRDRAISALYAVTRTRFAQGGMGAVAPVVEALRSGDPRVAPVAAAVLSECGAEGFAVMVEAAAGDGAARQVVVDVLVAEAGSPQPADYDDAPLRQALVHLNDGDAARRLALRLRLENPSVRRRIEGILSEMRNPGAVEPLIEALSASTDERVAAARILGHIGDPRAVEPLVDALRHADDWLAVDVGITRGLSLLDDPRTTELLLEMATGDDPAVGARAISVLGEVGDERAVPALVEALRSGSDGARKALERLTARGFGTDEARQAQSQSVVRSRVEALLGAIADGDRRHLKARLKDVKQVADGARTLLRQLADDPDESIRTAARTALDKLG